MAILIFALSACGSEQDSADDSNIRTLSFYSSSAHIGAATQAARDMNASWQARGYPYELVLDIDSFPFRDYAGAEARYTRFMMQLMAGQGPDVFIFETEFDTIALARSGFLADFNKLIDNCPRTSRDDFFSQALEGFEMHGGLYMLPVNFGFHHVAINTNLPQSVISSFTRHEFITIEQMMAIYLELIENYPDEFGDMRFVMSNATMWGGQSESLLPHKMSAFVDFEARTSDLTNPEFVSFLETYSQVRFNRFNGAINRAYQLHLSTNYVFVVHTSAFGQAHNFLTPYEPVFCNPRLLANNEGKLMTVSPVRSVGTSGFFHVPAIGATAAGNNDLAWEFIQYLLRAYSEGAKDSLGEQFNYNYFGSPIVREFFEHHVTQGFEGFLDTAVTSTSIVSNGIPTYLGGGGGLHSDLYVGMNDPAERARQIEGAVQRLALYNEMPMIMLHSTISTHLFEDNARLFTRGVITPQEFAQRAHNAVAVWLLE